ncbi:MAG: hypothetical protein WCQ16_05480 [Verrucomicrobiae bacterium]
MKFPRPLLCFGLVLPCVLFSACKDKNAVQVYRVSKGESDAAAPGNSAPESPGTGVMPAMGAPAEPGAPASVQPPQVTGTPPSNWEARPLSAMRQASYLVKGDNGATADISLVILAGPAGGALDNINRWLSQLGQPEITAEQLAKIARHVASPLGDATVVDLEGLPQGGDAAKDGRIVAGIISGDSRSFFFKMRGNAALAESQKEAFIQWIGTMRQGESAPPAGPVSGAEAVSPAASVAATEPVSATCPVAGATPVAGPATCPVAGTAPAADSEKPRIKWEAPAGWKPGATSAMRQASFSVAGQDGESADISVSVLGGDGGGDLENVNRWRDQIGLGNVEAGELKALVVPVACHDGEIFTVDMAGPKARMLVGWAKVDGKSWFFKLIAPDRLAGGEKAGFEKFLRSVQFHP